MRRLLHCHIHFGPERYLIELSVCEIYYTLTILILFLLPRTVAE